MAGGPLYPVMARLPKLAVLSSHLSAMESPTAPGPRGLQGLRKFQGLQKFTCLLLLTLFVLATATMAVAESNPDAEADSSWDAVAEYPGAERQGAILQALSLGLNFSDAPRGDCVWRRPQDSHDVCPDGDVSVHLYSSPNSSRAVNVSEASSLLQDDWDPQKHTVVLVHGYGGAHDTLPTSILRDAYLTAGGYNVLVLDWARLARLPCYPAAVHNAAVAARCVGGVARLLRDSGARGDAWTCVGHSLGAHVCGIMADTVMFRVHKIIGLDPARPLIRPQNKHRLDAGDASVVHVMHTNAGHYGELGAIGTADFCINGGRTQPFCQAAKNPNLCSHLSSICFLADSIDGTSPLMAEPCGRRCPSARRQTNAHKQTLGMPSSLGQLTPDSASGTFCASTSAEPPYCQREPGGRGHPRCCPPRHAADTTTTSTTSTTPPTTPSTSTAAAAVTPEASTASTVGTGPATSTTESSFKVGAALPTTTTEPPPETTTQPPASPGFTPVTAPVRAEGIPLAGGQGGPDSPKADASVQVTTATAPVRFPTSQPPQAVPNPESVPAVEVPVDMLPPPMPLPDWKPIMFVEPSDAEAASAAGAGPAVRPSEPLLPGKWTPPPHAEGHRPTAAAPAPENKWTPERWTPPPMTVNSDDVADPAATVAPAAPAAPAAPVRWPPSDAAQQHQVSPSVHIVMPSNDTLLYTEDPSTEGPVFAVYSTRSPSSQPFAPSPVVVVMADSGHRPQPQQRPQEPQQQPQQHPQQQHDIRDNLIEPSTTFYETTSPTPMDQEMFAMMEMNPPPPEPVIVTGFPSPSPPPPEPAAPEEAGMIPAAGSPMGAWLPMVMLPPMPFSVDSWALRYKDRAPRPSGVRRTSYRKKVYD